MNNFKAGDSVFFHMEGHHTFKPGQALVVHKNHNPADPKSVIVCDPEDEDEPWLVEIAWLKEMSEAEKKAVADREFLEYRFIIAGVEHRVNNENLKEWGDFAQRTIGGLSVACELMKDLFKK